MALTTHPSPLSPIIITAIIARSIQDTAAKRQFLIDLIHSLPVPVYLAYNSPRRHVLWVLTALGLRDVEYEGIVTPDSCGVDADDEYYPTKRLPELYYKTILERYKPISSAGGEGSRIVLLDDSRFNIDMASDVGIMGIQVNNNSGTAINTMVEEAIAIFLGHIEPAGRLLGSYSQTNDNKPSSSTSESLESVGESTSDPYIFSDVRYLQSKNTVDMASINLDVWVRLAKELSSRLLPATNSDGSSSSSSSDSNTLRVVDVGAGLLSMLRMMLDGGGGKKSLISLMEGEEGCITSSSSSPSLRNVQYIAYEPNRNLVEECRAVLDSMGFTERSSGDDSKEEDVEKNTNELIFHRSAIDGCNVDVTVLLRIQDFRQGEEMKSTTSSSSTVLSPPLPPHLIVGCCFADLFDPPHQLVSSLLHLIGYFSATNTKGGTRTDSNTTNETLLYFPITFAGTTQFVPPKPFGIRSPSSSKQQQRQQLTIPSDTTAFQLYAQALTERHGHNLDPNRIISSIQQVGGTLLAKGRSNWNIDSNNLGKVMGEKKDDGDGGYLWETMLYFFGTSAAPEMMMRGKRNSEGGGGWDAVGWLERARDGRPDIIVENVDILFSLPSNEAVEEVVDTATAARGIRSGSSATSTCSSGEVCEDDDDGTTTTCDDENRRRTRLSVERINFTAPRTVGTVIEEWDTTDGSHLGPGQIEVQSICSLISSGTELKIFKGEFSPTAPLDVNIPGLSTQTMSYPLTYGYSSVGRVTRCASDIPKSEAVLLLNRLVFTFSPHASHHIVDKGDAMLVPEGIDAEDAIFLPAVETALSIVHDAHVRVGEEVVVLGQGLIGLLVTRILSGGVGGGGAIMAGGVGGITAVDTLPDRLAMSSRMGASQSLLPNSLPTTGTTTTIPFFDVAIEVSGNPRALQSAIDATRSSGRIVIASWYGDTTPVSLKLGIDFHRSRKTLLTSQVSTIPPGMVGSWSKERRFDVVWELVRGMKPGRVLLTRRGVRLADAQGVYESLSEGGKEIAVSFVY